MMQYSAFRAMNSDILLAAEGSPQSTAPGFERARAFVEASEARLTRFSPDSELAQLNRSSGTWFHASDMLYDIVRQARLYFDETGGLFNPAILDALESAGYDRSMDEIRKSGVGGPSVPGRRGRLDLGSVRFDEDRQAILLPPGMRLDLGGIAKGWIAEHAAHILAESAPACAVSAGGDMFLLGLPSGESVWEVALEDPRDPQGTLAVLRVGSGAVATSSIAKRRWLQGDRAQHHLIDPRTGTPAATDWQSVTVVAPHATTAEVFAKVLLIAGSGQAAQVAARREDVVFIAVDQMGKLWGSGKAKELLDVGIEGTG